MSSIFPTRQKAGLCAETCVRRTNQKATNLITKTIRVFKPDYGEYVGKRNRYHKLTYLEFTIDRVIKPSNVVITKRQTVFLNSIALGWLSRHFSDSMKSKEVYLKIWILIFIFCAPASKAKKTK